MRRVYVYFVQAGRDGLIKIGQTRCFKTRLAGLKTMSPTELVPLGTLVATRRYNERSLHNRFKSHRQHGEWFTPASELLGFIAKHAKPFDGTKPYSSPAADQTYEDVGEVEAARRNGANLFAYMMHSLGCSKQDACDATNEIVARSGYRVDVQPDDFPTATSYLKRPGQPGVVIRHPE